MSAVGPGVVPGFVPGAIHLDTAEDLARLMQAPFVFDPPQWEAVRAPLRPGVIVAGAGSGKTAVMAARVVYLVATGQVTPDQVLGLTFTTKATAELGHRVRTALATAGLDVAVTDDEGSPERAEPTVSTYNAYASLLLSEHGLRIGHEPDTRVMADASRYQVAAAAVAAHAGAVEHLTESPKHVIEALLALDAELNEHLVSPAQVRAWQARERPLFEASLAVARGRVELAKLLTKMAEREELLDLVEGYRALKHRLGLMDFSDQIALAAELARTQPAVAQAERDTYRIVLLDEYQDTSVAQAELLAALFSGPTPEAGLGHAVTAVGDPNQAIYGWRGASVSNILHFDRAFPTPDGGARQFSLTVSQRSDRRVVAAANALAAPLYAAFPGVAQLAARDAAGEGTVRAPRHATYADELTWLATQVIATRAAMPEPSWAGIGVLTRDNAHAADVFDALSAAEVPVEIVGLKGLLRLPEVSVVVSTLALLDDLAANADLLNLLTGPRWAIGPRDLALLGRRARELAGRTPSPEGLSVEEELRRAVEDADPTELVCLGDALADPGPAAYSDEARERFGLLAGELRVLRQHVGEPLPDLVRRIVDATGIDVELAASVSPAARARRDNLDLFLKAVAEFQAFDGRVTLTSLLAWLEAEDDGGGLDQATPSEADSVKLLTVHRAKGLEYDAVFLVGVSKDKFPVETARSQWHSVGKALPAALRGDRADIPQVRGHEKADLVAYHAANKAHQQVEELRLGYVALTRAKHELWVSSYQWGPTRKKPLPPSDYQQTVRRTALELGWEVDDWPEEPEEGATNPLLASPASHPWPTEEQTAEHGRRLDAAARVRAADADAPDEDLDTIDDAARVAQWDADLDRLLAEARAERADVVEVPLPPSLSATALARLRADPDAFAAELARPMPRPPSRAARFGTRFHGWVEARFGQQSLLDADELGGRGDAGIDDEADLAELAQRFEQGDFGDRAPYATEAPFSLVLAGQVVRGRIDAVYREPDGSWLVVDWKTQRHESADPFQLAVYRVAWAELQGVAVEEVQAAFHYVRSGRTDVRRDLAGRAELEALVRGPQPASPPAS